MYQTTFQMSRANYKGADDMTSDRRRATPEDREFRDTVIAGLTRIETEQGAMHREQTDFRRTLVGNGGLGRIGLIEAAIMRIKQKLYFAQGAVWIMLTLGASVIGIVVYLVSTIH